jgi:hypothetical protein
MLGWDRYGFDNKCIGTRYAEHLFLHLLGSAGHVVHFGAPGEQIVDTLFFKLRWDRYGCDKKCFRTRYAKLVFLHPVGSVGHVVHFGAFGERIVDTIFFKLGWDRSEYDKKRYGTRYAKLFFSHPVGSVGHVVIPVRPGCETSMHYFSCFSGTGTGLTKRASIHVVPILFFCI